MLREIALLSLSSFLVSSLPGGAQGTPGPAAPSARPPSFQGEVDVALATLAVRVLDSSGQPVPGLKPEDFRVRVGEKEIPIAAVDWAGEDPATAAAPAAPTNAGRPADPAPAADSAPRASRLMVLFVQADFQSARARGQLSMRSFTREILDRLPAGDPVAVVSFDSHLKLRQDFSLDRAATSAALDQAILMGTPPRIEPAGPYSLARSLDAGAALQAASPERALEVTARALEPLPGEKTMVFLGFGFGHMDHEMDLLDVKKTPDYEPAVRALRKAHVAVFALDVTQADGHSLEGGLRGVAETTGGLYVKTYQPGLQTRTLAQAVSGYYVLNFDRSQLLSGRGQVQVELRDRRRGTVLARPEWVSAK
jgi:VWFA-related protein